MTFNEVILKIITLMHILFILFTVLTPFNDSNYFLLLHCMVIPFMVLHWILNDNTCFLTTVERKLRKQISGTKYTDDDCVTCKLIEPVYDFRKNYESFTAFIYTLTISLWLLSSCKLCYKYYTGQIKNVLELFKL